MQKVTLICYTQPHESVGGERGMITNVIDGWGDGPQGIESRKKGFYTRANLQPEIIAMIHENKYRLAFEKNLPPPFRDEALNPQEKSPWSNDRVVTATWLEAVPPEFWQLAPEEAE